MECAVMRIDECCVSVSDGDHLPPPKAENGVPFITISNINPKDNSISFSNAMYVPREYYESVSGIRKAVPGDILYSVVGSFGIPVLIKEDKEFVFQRHIAILRPDRKVVIPEFLYYIMRSNNFFSQADAYAIGSAQRTLSLGSLRKMKVAIPSLCVQEKIVTTLSAYDNLIETNNKRIKVLEQMAENLYKEWFVRFRFPGHERAEFENGIPKGWRTSTLGKEARFINGRAYLMHELQETGKYRIIRVGNFSGKDEWLFSDMELEKEKYCEQGDLLYKWSCNFGPEIWNEEKAIYHYHIWKVLPGEKITKAFLFHYLANSTKLWLGGTNGTAMAHITKESIEKKKIVVPSSEKLQAFESYAHLIMDQVLSLKKKNENLIQQHNFLLPRLMSGKLEV